jgi:ATP/maltotriose-dependent transcriptional regulator MalT
MADTIVGREAELAAIDRLLDSERPALEAIVVGGEPGIGKTTIWQAALDLAAANGLETLWCRPVEAEAKLALASLSDLLAPLVDTGLPELPEPQRLTLEVTLLRTAPRGAPPDARAVATATHSLLRARAARGPFLIAIDDVQWLDRSSAAALSFSLRRLAEVPARVLLAVRVEQPASPSPDPLDLGRNLLDVDYLRLGPISLGGLHHLLKGRLGQVLPRPMLQRIAQASGGNPLLALELARALPEVGAQTGPGEPLPVPASLVALLRKRLRRLPASARDALLAAAALSHPEPALISEALGEKASAGLEAAEQAGIIHVRDGVVRFEHPLFASALYGTVSLEKRRVLHLRLADVAREPEEQARHLALAAAGPDAAVAQLLEEAAEHARLRGAPDAAGELMELSLQLTPDDGEVPHRTAKLAGFLNAAGDVPRSEAVLKEAIPRMPRGPARAEAILLYGVIVSEPADHARSIEWCLEALPEAAGDPQLEARVHVYLAQSFGDLDEQRAVEHARRAVELLEPVDRGLTYANALQALAQAELLAGFPPNDKAIDEAMAIEARELRGRFAADLMFVPAFWSSHCDDFASAYTRFQGYLELAEDAGDEAVRPYLLGHLAETECQQGRWASAVQHADEAVVYAEQIGQRGHAPFMAMYSRACVAAFRGELEEADATAERLDDQFENPAERGRVFVLSLRGFVELSRGDLAAADRYYTQAEAILAAIRIREPARFRYQGDHVEAVIGLGDLEHAEEMVQRLSERATVFPRPWTLAVGARARGLLQAAHGDLEGAEAALRDALVAHGRLPMPFELGRTHLALGQLLRRRGSRRESVDAFERAKRIFEELGAPVWSTRAESELRRIPVRRRTRDGSLTPTEEQVAELAATGRTNREVAQTLFLSPKTVEANLSRIYKKLGIHSRAELGARMAELRQDGPPAKP